MCVFRDVALCRAVNEKPAGMKPTSLSLFRELHVRVCVCVCAFRTLCVCGKTSMCEGLQTYIRISNEHMQTAVTTHFTFLTFSDPNVLFFTFDLIYTTSFTTFAFYMYLKTNV